MPTNTQNFSKGTLSPRLIGLGCSGFLIAFAFGFAATSYGTSSQAAAAGLLLLPLLLAFLLLQVLFLRSGSTLAMVLLAESLAVTLPFIFPLTTLNLLAGCALLVILWTASHRGVKAQENQINVRLPDVGRRLLPRAMTGIALFVALTSVSAFMRATRFSVAELDRETFAPVAALTIESFAKGFIGEGFSLAQTPRQATELFVLKQLGPQAEKLSAAKKKAAVDQVEKRLRNELQQKGIVWKDPETLFDVLYRLASEQWKKAPTAMKLLLPISVGVSVFFVVKSLGLLLAPLGLAYAYILYKISLWTTLAVRTTEKVEREVIVYS